MSTKLFISIFAFVLFFTISTFAQTSAFVYQGKLNDGALAATGTYQFQFKLYDAASGGNQIGQAITDLPATVTGGIFAVNLDFGANSFDGAPRYLEIGVRLSGSAQPYTLLNPRQAITSTPYAVKSLKANEATTAITANDSLNLGNIPAAQYTQNNDARLSDARTPTAFSTYYVQNGTSQQANSNFNVSGEGKANVLSATTQFNIGTNRILSNGGFQNLFVGADAGTNNAAGGTSNSFVGTFAGQNNQPAAIIHFSVLPPDALIWTAILIHFSDVTRVRQTLPARTTLFSELVPGWQIRLAISTLFSADLRVRQTSPAATTLLSVKARA